MHPPDSSPPPAPSPATTSARTFLSVDICPRHGFAMLALMTLDDSGIGGGTRLLGPKSCCAERREVARWQVSADDLERLASEFRPPSAPPAPAPGEPLAAARHAYAMLRDPARTEEDVTAAWNTLDAILAAPVPAPGDEARNHLGEGLDRSPEAVRKTIRHDPRLTLNDKAAALAMVDRLAARASRPTEETDAKA